MLSRNSCGWMAVVVMAGLAGCSDTTETGTRAPSTPAPRKLGDSASRRIDGVTVAQVEPIADQVFRTHFRLDQAASTASVLTARPADAPDLEQRGQSGDMLSITPRRKRRLAELRLNTETGGVLVQVRVMTQRLSTAERTAFAHQMGDDRPSEGGLDHGPSAGGQPREEWVDWRRDRKLEDEILSEIQSNFTTTRPAATSVP